MALVMCVNIDFYNRNAATLVSQYNSIDFETVHQSWRWYWPQSGDRVLDVGAGSGRDANWLSQQGCLVVAVEPAKILRDIARPQCSQQIQWLDDSLPALNTVSQLTYQFDLILLSALWMHLTSQQRQESIKVLSHLLSVNGSLVITLRYGDFNDERETYDVSVEELNKLSEEVGLSIVNQVFDSQDSLKRANVTWRTVVLKSASSVQYCEVNNGT